MGLLDFMGGDKTDFTAKEFFDEIVPKVLDARKDPCKELGGIYGFRLIGETGGAWTLDFNKASLADGVAEETDLYLEMDAEDFAKMFTGMLDMEKAAREGGIRFEGDVNLFGNLAAIFAPPQD